MTFNLTTRLCSWRNGNEGNIASEDEAVGAWKGAPLRHQQMQV